jgi:catechol 2,3-dioxygenase-like lactoylglutathione lyase family enzyme
VANQTGRPIAPARKLVAAVLGTIAIFVMVFGLGLSSWAIVALGAAMLALAVALGMVTVARRGARAWVSGYAQVKAISEPPTSTAAYGRAEMQLVVVVSGLPTTEVLVRESRVPVAKWPTAGDQLPVTVDVDDMRRVRIDWDQTADRADDGDPPPPPATYAAEDDFADDDILGDVEPPPWQNRDREWGRGPGEPPPPGVPDPDDPGDTAVVVRETPAGPVLEGQFVDHADAPPPLPHRARAADPGPGAGRPPGSRPSPHPHRAAATATVDPGSPSDPGPDGPPDAAPPASASAAPSSAVEGDGASSGEADALRAEPGAARPPADDEIDLPLDGDPEPPPEVTDPDARRSVDEGLTAPPPPTDTAPAGDPEPERRVFVMDPAPAGPPAAPPAEPSAAASPAAASPAEPEAGSHAATPAPPTDTDAGPAPHNGSHAAVPEQRSGLGKAATAVTAAAAAAAAGLAASRRKTKDDDATAVPPQPSAAERDNPDTATGAPRPRGPWSDLEGGYEPDERADEVLTAYPSARPGPSGAIHGVGLTIAVTELSRSVAFYRDMLGFFEIDRGADSAILASGDTRLVLRTGPGHAPAAGPQLNLEVGDLEAMHDELQGKGVRFAEAPHPVTRGGRLELWAASFPDPDGNTVAITQWRALR